MIDLLPIEFGTDGWRGLLGTAVNRNTVGLVAQAYADYLSTNSSAGGIAIGYDGRSSSGEFASIMAGVMAGNGFEVFLSEQIVPTPVVSYAVRARGLAGGVMITASHNPPNYNGVKFKGPYGGPLMTEETLKIEQLLGRGRMRAAEHVPPPVDLLTPYLDRLEELIDVGLLRGSGLSVAVDSMAGAGGRILESLLHRWGCKAVTVDGVASADFGGRNPEPTEANLAPLAELLRRDGTMALGLATDGDADRCGVLQEGGRWLSAQDTILLLAHHILVARRETGSVVKTSSVTDKLRTLGLRENRQVHDVQVGFKHIAEKMIAESVAIGCEESGGFGFGVHVPERDGLFSSLLVMEMLARSGCRTLGEFHKAKAEDLGTVHYRRLDLVYDRPDRMQLLPSLVGRTPSRVHDMVVTRLETYGSSRGTVNGMKCAFEGDCRWLLIRSSETEPMIRLYAEGQTESEVEALLSWAHALVFAK